MRKVLSWEPEVSLEEWLEKTYRWIEMTVMKAKEGEKGGKV